MPYVVLLNRDIQLAVDALEAIRDWTFSKDRDYEEEQKENPIAFDYAAVHFVVRASAERTIGDLTIPSGLPCEVQIKTILQHAYSELTHDTIYKPQIVATPSMRRNAAKSMALIEATNDYFEKVADDVANAIGAMREATRTLSDIYVDKVGPTPEPTEIEGLILDRFGSSTVEGLPDRVRKLFEGRAELGKRIREAAQSSLLFRQPSILLVYTLASENPRALQRNWPLTPRELEPVLTHLGISPRD